MKKYKFLFTKIMYLIFALGLLLCCAGVGVSIYRFIAGSIVGVVDWIGFVIMLFACVLLGALIISMLVSSKYTISDTHLTLWLGIIRNRYELTNVNSVHLFEGAGKLAIYLKDGNFNAIVIKRSEYDDFVKTLMEKNEKIGFSYSTAEEEETINHNDKK